MYTRSYQIKKEPPRADREEAELPLIEEQAEPACDVESVDESAERDERCEASRPEMKKRRYRAVRIPNLREPSREPCEQEKHEDDEEQCPKPQPPCKSHDRFGLFRGLSSDELLVLALIVLLICEGGDDILILALCFILS